MFSRIVALAWMLLGAAAPAIAQIKVLGFDEIVDKDQLISGEGLVGALVADMKKSVALDRIEINVPAGASGITKIQLLTADGTYVGTIRVSLDGATPGWQRLDGLRSQHSRKLFQYNLEGLTFLAEGPGEDPMLIRLAGAPLDTVRLYINSEKSDAVVAYRKDGDATSQPCRKLTGSMIKFDTICSVPFSVVAKGPVRVIRSRDGAALPPLDILIAIEQ